MSLRVNNIRLGVEQSEDSLPDVLARTLGVSPNDLSRWRILRKSLDARSRDDLMFVYSAAVDLAEDEQRVFGKRRDPRVESYEPARFEDAVPGPGRLSHR